MKAFRLNLAGLVFGIMVLIADIVYMPWWAIIVAALSVVVLAFTSYARHAMLPKPEPRRPDYAKIARLEAEIFGPPQRDPSEPQVRVTKLPNFDPNGFGWKTYGVRSGPPPHDSPRLPPYYGRGD